MLLKEEKRFSFCARKDKEHQAFVHFDTCALIIYIGLTSIQKVMVLQIIFKNKFISG